MYRNNYDQTRTEEGFDTSRPYVEVRPWPRLLARVIDYFIFISVIIFIFKKLLNLPLEFLQTFLLYLAGILIWVPVEALLLSLFGKTPGKWLLSITISGTGEKKPGFADSLKRSLLVWMCGILAGLPFVNIPGLMIAYHNLTECKTTLWDRKSKCEVSHGYYYPVKLLSVFAILAVLVAGYILKPMLKPIESIFSEDLQLINPLYQNIHIDESGNVTIENINTGESAWELNKKGYNLLVKGLFKESKEVLLKGLQARGVPSDKDAIYCNLSCACYNLGEYSQALIYIKVSLNILPNSLAEYMNYANALKALGRKNEAFRAYETAQKIDGKCAGAYYGLGFILYEEGKYEEAAGQFSKYVEYEKKDADGWCYLGISYLYGKKDLTKAKEFLDKAYRLDSANAFVIEGMAKYYDYINDKERAEKVIEEAIAVNPADYLLLCFAAEYFCNRGRYKEAGDYADYAIIIDRTGNEAYRIKAWAYLWDGEEEKAEKTIREMINNDPADADAYIVAGDFFYNFYKYKKAQAYYEKAEELNNENILAVIGKIRCLYSRKRYEACLDSALYAEDRFDDHIILWFAADAYSALGNSEKAIHYYDKALARDPENMELILSLGREYYANGNFDKAVDCANQALSIDGTYYGANDLKISAEKRLKGNIEQITEFIETNYMYYKQNEDYESEKNRLKKSSQVKPEDISRLFETVRQKDDTFSFVLYGDLYNQYVEMCKNPTTEYRQIDDNIHYIRITEFMRNTSNEFVYAIDSIKNPERAYLVLDLRGNGGGDTNSGLSILDFLLPECVVCNLIHKDGYTESYYSDIEHIPFRHIFVLTDENTASCSELVALGLKTYLDNVTIIGGKTFGKGVGQLGFEDKKNNMILFVVNHFWNVREVNIKDKGIEPDIQAGENTLESLMEEVRNCIAQSG
jgi:tetratricopeptide (TPR) repeat protein